MKRARHGTVRTAWIFVGAACLATARPAPAEEPAEAKQGTAGLEVLRSEPLPFGERVVFRSAVFGQEVSMNLYVPESFSESSDDHTYPVVFVNGYHGERFFPVAAGLVKHLGDVERMPESIVVSLNDMGPIPEVHTHGMWSRETLDGSPEPEKGLRHLELEVIPFLEKTYRAADYRLVVGVSGSSLFPIYTFTEAPGLFHGHVLIAAADMVGMGFSPESTFIDAFEASLKKTPERGAKLYVGIADSDLSTRQDYRDNLEQLRKRLGGLPGLDLEVEVLDRTEHYEAFVTGLHRALDQHFPKERWWPRYRDLVAEGDALERLDAYYAALSNDYGITILPRAERWNSVNSLRFMTRHLVGLDRAKEAIAVAERRIAYRPRSAAPWTGLADALEADGRPEAAVEALEKALALATDEQIEPIQERLEALKKTLAEAAE